MRISLLVIVFLFCFTQFLHSQVPSNVDPNDKGLWWEMMQDPNAEFEETVRLANEWFDKVGTGKGTGFKQFKRWEYWMKDRLGPDGRQNGRYIHKRAWDRYMAEHENETRKRDGTTGSWVELGPVTQPLNGTTQPNGNGRIASITFHPTDANTVYAGSASGGIWMTTDYGSSWSDISGDLPRLGVSSIQVHHTNDQIIYIGTGDRDGGDAPGYGVYYTTNGGTTWQTRNSGMGNRTIYELLMHPSNANIMIASAANRIYRTTDGGANWSLQYSAGQDFKDMKFKPGDPNTVYACDENAYISTDNGVSWNVSSTGLPAPNTNYRTALGTTSANANYVYLLIGQSNGGLIGVYRSTNSGSTWSLRANSPDITGYNVGGGGGDQNWYNLIMAADPADADHITTGTICVWSSNDGGTNWDLEAHWASTSPGNYIEIHADHHVLEYSPHTGHLWNGNDGGVYYSTDGGTSWPEVTSGLGISQMYKIGQAQITKDLCITGFQDNGTAFRRNGTWYTEIGGDGMECIVDPTDETYMYGALYYGDIRRSSNSGASFGGITGGISESGGWVTPYKLAPGDPNTMYVGMRDVWRTNDVRNGGGPSWTSISNFPGNSTCVDLDISKSNPDILYVSINNTQLWRTANATAGSPTWTDVIGTLPNEPRDIEIHPTDPTTVWVTVNNDVYMTTNSGGTWTNYSGTLPNVPMNTIAFDTATASTIEAMYLGTDFGIYYRDNTLADWVLYNTGFPEVEVTELEIFYDTLCRGNDMLRAGTYGRGLWESDLKDPGTLAPSACFMASPASGCVGQVFTLSDQSAYTPTSWSWSISPGTHAYVNGTSNTDQNPQVSFSATGTYNVTLTATNANGSDAETRNAIINISGAAISPPYTEDFESDPLCGTATDCGTTVCTFANPWTNWTNGSEDDIDWRTDEGGTASGGTGPSVDANPGTAVGNYAYTEASGGCTGQTAIVESPCIDLTSATNPEFIFAYHMEGTNMGDMHVDAYVGGSWVNDITPMLSGDQGSTWQDRNVSLAAYVGDVIKLRVRGITGGGYESDMAIDNLRLQDNALAEIPVNLRGQYVSGIGNQVWWEIDQSLNADHYVLERLDKFGAFKEITTISDEGDRKYEYFDLNPLPGRNLYKLSIIDPNGEVFDGGTVEILNVGNPAEIVLFPNPAQDEINLNIVAENAKVTEIMMFDLTGQYIRNEKLTLNKGSNTLQFDISDMPRGLYFLKYETNTLKFIVE